MNPLARTLTLAAAAVLGPPAALYSGVAGILAWNQRAIIYPGAGRPAPAMRGDWTARTFPAPGGEVRGYVLRGSPSRPTVVFLHGNWGSYDSAVEATRRYADAGMTVVVPEYPGYGGDRTVPTQAGLARSAVAAFDAVVREGARPSSVFVVDNSIGSSPAIALASARRPGGVALISAFTDMASMARRRLPLAPSFLLSDAFDNEGTIRDVRVPILVVHGSADGFVPTTMGRRLAEAARARLVLVPGGHEAAYGAPAQDAVLEWMERLSTNGGRESREASRTMSGIVKQ